MRAKKIWAIVGQVILIEAAFLLIPLFVSIGYKENIIYAYIICIASMAIIGSILARIKGDTKALTTSQSFGVVALSWLVVSFFGCLPFFISRQIPNFIDSLFESVSGFTTTGATILQNVENLPKSLILWRSFTHWLGGLGIFVFIIAILPKTDSKKIHLFKAESPGPQVGKLVGKLRITARILYSIYIVLTLIQVVLLLIGKMSIFDSFVHAFGTAGTGGFSSRNNSIAAYDSVYIDVIISVFMIIFAINFNIYFLIIMGKVRQAWQSQELRVFLLIIFVSTVAITINLVTNSIYLFFGDAFRHSIFQVSSFISTTGYVTADYINWPTFSKTLLFVLMFIGGCAGSTAGGLKISRFIILIKSGFQEFRRVAAPREVTILKMESKPIDNDVHSSVLKYFVIYMIIFVSSVLLVSISSLGLTDGFIANLTAVTTCINNVGPFFGSTNNMGDFSTVTKIILAIDMLLGRLEIYPILILLTPRIWRQK